MKSRSHLSQLTFYAEAGGGGSLEDLGLDPTLILRLTEGKQAHATLRFKTRASSVGEIYWWREAVCYFEIRPPEGASHPGHSDGEIQMEIGFLWVALDVLKFTL